MRNNSLKIHSVIRDRKSILSFSDKKITNNELDLLFEAARWAPSSYNQQPWRFIYALKPDKEYGRMLSCLMEGNRIWASTAPVLVLSIAEIRSDYKNKLNRFGWHDLGMAVGNLLSQATNMGLFVHQMGGYDIEKARELLNIPERFEPAAMMAIGYRGEKNSLPADLIERENAPRTRNDISEFVFKNSWGKPA